MIQKILAVFFVFVRVASIIENIIAKICVENVIIILKINFKKKN